MWLQEKHTLTADSKVGIFELMGSRYNNYTDQQNSTDGQGVSCWLISTETAMHVILHCVEVVRVGEAHHFDGLMQKRRNSSVLAFELRLSSTNPSI